MIKYKKNLPCCSAHVAVAPDHCLQIGRPLYTQESVSAVASGALRQRSQSVLLVDEVREVDQGTYTCTAQNLQGARSVSTTVTVLPKAKPRKKP